MTEARTLADRYQLKRRLGQGGMGHVWIASDLQLGRMVAIKVMSQESVADQQARQRFLREATASAQIQSPHVVQILDFGVDGSPFIVMELLVGEDLRARLDRVGKLPVEQASRMLRHLARGLRKAHELGFVHRDIKPANLFLVELDDDEEQLKILDFGVVKATREASATSVGRLLGSPRYMSPEQARGLPNLDQRSDLWSVGVVMFEMLTGARPFDAEMDADLLIQICMGNALKASSIDPALATYDAFFAHCFTPDPSQRYQSVQELVAGFEAATEIARTGRELAAAAAASHVAASLEDSNPTELRQLRTIKLQQQPSNQQRTQLLPHSVPPAAQAEAALEQVERREQAFFPDSTTTVAKTTIYRPNLQREARKIQRRDTLVRFFAGFAAAAFVIAVLALTVRASCH